MSKHYTGVGSRETPQAELSILEEIGSWCSDQGLILRSGGADGADFAFEKGCDKVSGEKEIYIPWSNFNDRSVREEGVFVRGNDINSRNIAETIHPVFHKLKRGAQALHTRNVNQVLGKDSSNPDLSLFLIYWAPRTKSGSVKGGTATAVNLAEKYNIPCWNIWDDSDINKVKDWIFSIVN